SGPPSRRMSHPSTTSARTPYGSGGAWCGRARASRPLSPEVPQIVIHHPRHHVRAVLGARADVVDGCDILREGGPEGFRGCDWGAGLEQPLDGGAAADGGRDARRHHPPAGAGPGDGETDLRDRLRPPPSHLFEHLVGVPAAREPYSNDQLVRTALHLFVARIE